jgi:hypothetical protein
VTLVLERAEGAPPVVADAPRRRLFLSLLPWLAPAVAWTVGLLHTGTPAGDIALYSAYLAVAIVLPGTLVHRALRGSRGNLPEDLGLGAATGLFVLIVGWAICAATRLQVALPAWPLLVIALFVAVPRLRRFWRIPREERRRLPVSWSWIVAAVALVIVLATYPYWRDNPLPPATTQYYQDLMYHLALVQEMTRSVPFQVPQLTGDTLRYHYLSDADMATASMITRISPIVVLFRLWLVPIGLVTVVVSASLARELTAKWWAGALGGASALFAWPLVLGSVASAFGGAPLSFYSPSQSYALPLLGLLIAVSLDVLRGRRLGWAWALVFPLALACAGAKSSALPPLVAGLALAVVFLLLRQRDRLKAGLIFFGLVLLGMLVGAKLFAGGGAGTLAIQPFAVLDWVAPYRKTIGAGDAVDGSLALPSGVAHAGAAEWAFILGIVGWWLLMQAPRLLGLFALTARRTRTEPAAWMLAGVAVAGTGGAWLLWHPSASQVYFYMSAAPFAAVLTVWLLADQLRGWRPLVAGLAAGAVWALLAPHGPTPKHNRAPDWAWAIAEPVLLTAGVAVVVALAVLLAWRFATGRYAWRAIPAGLIAAVLGSALAGAVQLTVNQDKSHPAAENPKLVVTADEMRAALWLGEHSGRDDVIATNVHCQPVTSVGACDARAFWAVGLSGRRAIVESWGYTDQAVASNGGNGKRYTMQPAPYPDRFTLNERVFAEGAPADVERLRNEYHVKWLLADARAVSGVSPNLARVCHLRYQSGPVSIFELGAI